MNKKRATRKKPNSYTIPYKNETSTEDLKLMSENKRKLSEDASNNEEKTTAVTNFKANKLQNQFKQTKRKKIPEKDENLFEHNKVYTNPPNSCDFSDIKINNEEGNSENTSFKNNEIENNFKSNVPNSNGHNKDGIDFNYYEKTDDINLLINEIIHNICENELKLITFQRFQIENALYKQKNALVKDEDFSNVIENYSSNSNFKDFKSESQGVGDFLEIPSNKTKDDQKEVRENDVEGLKDTNYNEIEDVSKRHKKSTDIEIEENFKGRNEWNKVSDSTLKTKKYKKQKMDNNRSRARIKNVKGNYNNFQDEMETFNNLCGNIIENVSSFALKTDNSNISGNNSLNENKIISDIKNSNNEKNKSFNFNSPQKDEKISQLESLNQTKFEENFTDLKSDSPSMSSELWKVTQLKKVLTIPCMSALEYINTFKQTEIEGSTNTDENFKLSSSSKELNYLDLKSQCTKYSAASKNELQETEFENNGNNTKYTHDNQTKHSHSHKEIACYSEIHKNKGLDSSIPLTTEVKTETNNDSSITEIKTNNISDKTECHDPASIDRMDQVSSISNSKTQNRQIGSSIFSDEELIKETIVFREKEGDDNDAIPTGVFKHLNEIFEYNNKTTSIDLRYATNTNMNEVVSEERAEGNRKCISSNEEMKTEETMPLINTNDFTASINNIYTSQDDLKITKTIVEANSNKNEENIDKNISLSNLTNTEQENDDNMKVCNNEENIKQNHRNEELAIKKERDAADGPESCPNTALKILDEPCLAQSKINEEKYFSDFENCMDMDDDFDLTASQLSMLDADEKFQSINKINAEQQTEISGSMHIKIDSLAVKIEEELNSLREVKDCLNKQLDELSRIIDYLNALKNSIRD